MSIKELGAKIKQSGITLKTGDLFVVLLVFLVAASAFAIGRLSVLESQNTPIMLEHGVSPAREGVELYVGSKTGHVYYYPWCAGALSILDENKVWFYSREEAQDAGYRSAINCKGLNQKTPPNT